jgi:hypothetical protein
MILTASPRASSRTKNRLRERGPEFEIRRVDVPQCFAGRRCAFVLAPCGWSGWLPLDELQENLSDHRSAQ